MIVVMGSAAETVGETVAHLCAQGERVGVLQVRLYRPFPARALLDALPASARPDRRARPHQGARFERRAALPRRGRRAGRGAHRTVTARSCPLVTGGRYGLSSKELTPGMVAGVFAELARERPRRRFTIGITDDVSGTSLPYDPSLDIEPPGTVRAVFFGLGSDGTVGANKNTIKILGAEENLHAQGYFVYDSKKSGSQTVSHLRFGPQPIRAPYLVEQASFVGCHQFGLLDRVDVLGRAAPGATLLLNCAHPPDEVWDALPRPVQEKILAKRIDVYAIDAGRIARERRPGRADQHRAADLLLRHLGRAAPRGGDRQDQVGDRQDLRPPRRRGGRAEPGRGRPHAGGAAPDRGARPGDGHPGAAAVVPAQRAGVRPHRHRGDDGRPRRRPAGQRAAGGRHLPERHRGVREAQHLRAGRGMGSRPVHPVRQLQLRLPAQRDQVHATTTSRCWPGARRSSGRLRWTPAGSRTPASRCRCTWRTAPAASCASQACPVGAPGDPARKAINLAPREPLVAAERDNIAFFETLPVADRSRVDFGTVRGTQFLQPLFEFSGACAGCGETPYIKLLSQLFGDRLMVANATGCSSIYGGNLPTTPWTTDADGRGPAWSNSLFEDNAEFGLGFRLAADRHTELARSRLAELRDAIGAELVDDILGAPQLRESELRAQRDRVAELKRRLDGLDGLTGVPPTCAAWSITWSGAACGSSAATAGPTTSAPAGSTTCWPAGAT